MKSGQNGRVAKPIYPAWSGSHCSNGINVLRYGALTLFGHGSMLGVSHVH